jgi:exosortase
MDTPIQAQISTVGTGSIIKYSTLMWIVVILPFAWLWFHLIDNLSLQWDTDPQWSYGLVVPLLTAGLLIRRWRHYSGVPLQSNGLTKSPLLIGIVLLLALFYLPTRLIEEATSVWRPIGWLLAVETIGLTLYGIYLLKGWEAVKRYMFPICFFLTAVPWPTLFETPIIQNLSRANAAMVVNVLGIIGIPAIQHGNIIEISTGMVGINDACSGIRSLHSCLMISLFMGEFYFMNWTRRILLVPAAFILAMMFNVCRTSLLTYWAAKKGIDAISQIHDEAGMTILLACTATLWGVSYLISLLPSRSPVVAKDKADVTENKNTGQHLAAFKSFAIGLIIWIVAAEVGIELWYSIREAAIKPGPKWSVVFPANNPTYKLLPLTPDERELLRYDYGESGQWEEPDGTVWQAFYFEWKPGRVAGYLAKRHTPDICLPAIGLKMVSGPTLMMMNVDGIDLPMRYYLFSGPDGPMQVFQCHWEPGMSKDDAYANESSRLNLIRSVWTTRGNKGQKVIEIVITGCNDPEAAREALVQQLQKLIKVDKTQVQS